MNTEMETLFAPIVARFEASGGAIARLQAENVDLLARNGAAARQAAALAEKVAALEKRVAELTKPVPPPLPPPPPPPPPPAVVDGSGGGWTVFPPPDPASGARVVYVSSSGGKNTNDGLSPDGPVESIEKAASLVRDGAGDRLLLRRGDTFGESFGNWKKSGRSPAEPMLFGAYGEGPRPKVLSRGSSFNLSGAGEIHDLAIVGLHLAAAGRDPAAPEFDRASPGGHGIRIVRGLRNLLIEDCRVELFVNNLTITGGSDGGAVTNVRVRRCQILDAWAATGAFAGQGLYANGCDGLLIEGNVFDHNGWLGATAPAGGPLVPGAGPNMYRHNVYVSANNRGVEVKANVIARAACHGVQLRCGGLVTGNLFFDNAIHTFLAGQSGLFRGNVVLGGRDISEAFPRGAGVTLAGGDGRAEDNILAHKPATQAFAFAVERGEWSPAKIRAAFERNVVYGWSGNGLEIQGDCDAVEFVGNDLQGCVPGRKVVTVKSNVASLRLADNRYDSAEPNPLRWFWMNGGYATFGDWARMTGDTSRVERVAYLDPGRTMPPDFLANARGQSRETRNENHTASAVIRSVREGFGK